MKIDAFTGRYGLFCRASRRSSLKSRNSLGYRVNLSRYIPTADRRVALIFDCRCFAAIDEECVMERNDDRNLDELIDLGSVVDETKGGSPGANDTVIQLQRLGIGLEDD